MKMYQEGYERYRRACEEYGMESMNIHLFVRQLSRDQLNSYNQMAKNMNGSEDYDNFQ